MTAARLTPSKRISARGDNLARFLFRMEIIVTEDPRFWDRIAVKYSKSPISNEETYQRKLTMTQDRLSPDMRVLEFGCGTGGAALAHAPHVAHIHAIDVSSRMIDIARERQAEANIQNVTFETSGIDAFDAASAPFDAILGLNVLHLVKHPDQVIRKAADMLKPGGYFITSTFAANDQARWLKFIAPIGKALGKFPPVLTSFSLEQLKAWHRAADLEIEEEWRTGRMNADFLIARKRSVH